MDEPSSSPRGDRPNTQRPLSGIPRSVGRIGPSHALVFVLLVAGVLGVSEAGVSQAGAIDVEAIDSNSPVAEGERLIVRTRLVCDVLEFGCGQTVRLVVGQVVRDSRFIELGSREETVVDFSWVPGSDDAGDYVATVVPEEGRSAETEVTVIEPANFVVEVESTTSPVPAGEPLEVTATVTNTGDVAGTQTVDLMIDQPVEDSTRVTLDEGESRTVTFTWQTGPDDVGRHTAIVRSEDAFDRTAVSVVEPANFVVEVESTTSPVPAGEPLEVTATVTNTGDVAGTRTVDLAIDGTVEDSTTVTLDEGESRTVTLVWQTGPDDVGGHTATVRSPNDSAVTNVSVLAPPDFRVEIGSTTSPVPAGEPLEVTATVTNNGDVAGTRTVDLVVDGTVQDSTTVTLDEGESRTVTLSWRTGMDDRGDHTASVTSPDDSAVTDVSVLAPPDFRVEIETAPSSVTAGESLEVTATITNTGDESATQDVELVVDGTVEDSTTVTLFGDESRTVTFTWQTGPDDVGGHTVSVESEDAFDRTAVSVVEPANFVVEVESTTSPVAPGESLEVTATVTNTGDVAGTRTVDLVVDGTVEDSTTVTLDGDGSRTVTFTWQTGPDDIGSHTASVTSPDDSAVTDVGVLAPPDFRVEIGSAPSSVTAGGSLDVTATVTNTGDEPATQDIELEIDGVAEDSTPVTLAGGGSRTVALSWQTGKGDAGTYDITVSSDDSSDTADVTVAEPANFSVTIDSENDTVTEGESTDITATVTNTGDESATREIVLEVNGTEVDRTEVTLAGGDSRSVTFTWQTGPGDAGRKHIVSVLSSDDDDRREFTVEESTTIEVGEFDLPPEAVVGTGVVLGLLWLAKRDVVGGIVSGIEKAIQKRLNGNGEDGEDDGEDGRPRADITVVPTDPAPFRPVLIDGSLSYDPDPRDRIVSYSWTVGDREESDRRFVHVFTETGDQEVTLEVRNQRGELGQDTETVTVEGKAGELELTRVHPDAPGRDHADLSEEYLVFANTGNETLELDGWTVHDAAEEEGRVAKGEHTFEFGEGLELAPEATVSIHTGEKPEDRAEPEGEPRERHLFWGRSWPVWNNDQDIVVVQDAEETPVLARRYERRDDQYVVEELDESTLVDWFRVPEAEDIDAVRR